jgi:hypothetical protein
MILHPLPELPVGKFFAVEIVERWVAMRGGRWLCYF